MGAKRKKNSDQRGILFSNDKVLEEACHKSDGTNPPHTWEKEIEKKAKEKKVSYLRGWLRVRFKNDRAKIQKVLNELSL